MIEDGPQLTHTAETRALWERYAVARQQADDSLLSADGLQAVQAWYAFAEAFMPQVFGANVVPMAQERRQRRAGGSPP